MSNQTEWWAPTGQDASTSDLFGGDRSAQHAPPSRRARSSSRRASRRRRRQGGQRGIVLVVALALVVGAGYVVYSVLGGMFSAGSGSGQVEDFAGPGSGSATVVVEKGDTGSAIGAKLVDAGVVATTKAFSRAFEANPDAAGIQPGSYKLLQGMPASAAVELLLNPSSRDVVKITFREGLTVDQIVSRISEKTLIPVDELKKTLKDGDSYGLPKQANGEPEGWLFPATYELEGEPTAVGVLSAMTAKTVEVLEKLKAPKDDWETIITKASLIEREAKHDEDRPKMARVIESRLEEGWTLGIDASTAYGLGKPGTELTRADNEDGSNPYNTRVNPGLPPTPIAAPGEKSIDAVLHPADGDWMYWCTVNLDTGETRFAETYDEQKANEALLRQWLAENG